MIRLVLASALDDGDEVEIFGLSQEMLPFIFVPIARLNWHRDVAPIASRTIDEFGGLNGLTALGIAAERLDVAAKASAAQPRGRGHPGAGAGPQCGVVCRL